MHISTFLFSLALLAVARLTTSATAALFAPALALVLYSGQHGLGIWRTILPLLALMLTDFMFGVGHTSALLGYFMVAAIAWTAPSATQSNAKAFIHYLVSITAFDLATNTIVWATGTMYPQTPAGWTACLAAAWPFYTAKIYGLVAVAWLHSFIQEHVWQRPAHRAI